MKYAKYPSKVFRCRELTPVDKHVYMTLAFISVKGEAEVSRALLAKNAGLAKNTVSNSLNKLKSFDFIDWTSGYRFGENYRVNTYYLKDPCHNPSSFKPREPGLTQPMASGPTPQQIERKKKEEEAEKAYQKQREDFIFRRIKASKEPKL